MTAMRSWPLALPLFACTPQPEGSFDDGASSTHESSGASDESDADASSAWESDDDEEGPLRRVELDGKAYERFDGTSVRLAHGPATLIIE